MSVWSDPLPLLWGHGEEMRRPGGLWPSRWTPRPGAGRALTPGVPAGQVAVQGLGVDVEGAVELLAVPLAAPLQVAQQVTEPDAQGCPGVPELEHEAHKG